MYSKQTSITGSERVFMKTQTIPLPKDTSFKEAFRFYIRLLLLKKGTLFFISFLLIVLVALQFTEPYLYKLIINQLEFNVGTPDIAKNLIQLGLVWVVVILSANIIEISRTIVIWRYMHAVWRKAWSTLTNKIFSLDISYHINQKSGSTLKKTDDFQQAFFMLGENTLLRVSLAICSFIICLIIIFSFDWVMALISLSTLPFFILSCVYVEHRSNGEQERVEKYWDRLFGHIEDSFSNIMSILSFGQERRFIYKIEETISHTQRLQEKVNTWWAFVDQSKDVAENFARILVIGVGAYRVTQGTLTIGDIVMFLGYVQFLYAPISVISSDIKRYQQWWKKYMKGIKILALDNAVVTGNKLLENPKGHISLQNVSFRYNDYKKNTHVIDNVSFEIKPGKTVALVGHSGAGKTTLTHLLEHFYDPNEGRVLFDGIDYKELAQETLRKHIGIVFQENSMFHDTIRMNVALGRPDASDEEIEAACKKAAIHQLISFLPKGYDTVVGERGIKLSGGQRQRIAIARAILKDPAFIILDEATSALDSKTEQEVQEAIKNLTKNKSTLIIAHRLSTIIHADTIIFMEHGKIVDMGSHSELLTRCAGYQELVSIQANGLLVE